MIKYVIFDFDGTLADTFEIIKKTVVKDLGSDSEEWFRLIKEEGIKEVMKKKEIPIWKIPRLTYEISKSLRNKKGIKLFPKIQDVFKKLSKNYKLGIISSNSEENIKEILKRNKIHDVFEFIYSDVSLFGKNLVFKKICNKYNLNPKEIIYVGDEDRDILAAKKAKVKVIAVTWGYNSEKRLKAENPDYLVNSPKELIRLFKKIAT